MKLNKKYPRVLGIGLAILIVLGFFTFYYIAPFGTQSFTSLPQIIKTKFPHLVDRQAARMTSAGSRFSGRAARRRRPSPPCRPDSLALEVPASVDPSLCSVIVRLLKQDGAAGKSRQRSQAVAAVLRASASHATPSSYRGAGSACLDLERLERSSRS